MENQGQFRAIESFAIKRKNQFLIIGQLLEGTIKPNWFVKIPFNSSTFLTLRISEIEEVEIAGDQAKYILLVSYFEDEEAVDLILGMNIGNEKLAVSIEGKD